MAIVRRLTGGFLLIAMLTLGTQALPAAASPGGVEVSPDGVNYGSSYSGSLFTSMSHLVPGDTDTSFFYLRNSASEPGFLRITLRDVVASDTDFGGALALSVSTFGHPGAPVSILEADPCWVLLEGQVVLPGEVVRVTTSLALGDLYGQSGQGATANAALSVALTGTATQLPATDCGKSGTVLPVAPQPPNLVGASATRRGSGAVGESVTAFTAVTPESPETELPVLNLPQLLGIDPNTWHLWEEYLILIPMGASVIGGLVFGIVARRRRSGDETESLA